MRGQRYSWGIIEDEVINNGHSEAIACFEDLKVAVIERRINSL